MHSFTAEELERETGFDRRTIAYYVQEGLIPRVGRRGPRTRYPKLVMDRLLFIRKVREAEEAGEIGPVSLSDLRRLFDGVSPGLIERVAEGSFSGSCGRGRHGGAALPADGFETGGNGPRLGRHGQQRGSGIRSIEYENGRAARRNR